jgi:cell division protease FtsH
MISTLFGGRLAEQIIFGDEAVSTGASNDIQRATEIARSMVTKWGLSKRLGPLTYAEEEGEVFLGRSVTQHKQVSDETAHIIDEEIRSIIDRNYKRAETILTAEREKLEAMAQALIQYETIDIDQITDVMEGRDVRPPKESEDKPPASSGDDGDEAEADKDAGKNIDEGESPKDDPDSPVSGPAGQH